MPVNHLKNGERRSGFIKMTLGVGFSGTVDIIWVVDFQKKMRDRLNVGEPLRAILVRSKRTVGPVMCCVAHDNGKLFYTGLMIVAEYDKVR